MTICYFGIYNPNHTRNRLMMQGLRANGVTVIECNTRDKTILKYWKLIIAYLQQGRRCDVVIVGFPGHTVMPLAWVLARLTGKKVIFDAFISLYDSFIFDEKKYAPGSFQAKKYWLVDWLACKIADRVLLEVWEYANYFMKEFRVPRAKLGVIYVACDNAVIYPREQKKETADFLIHFHGTYIPAQGIPVILRAAKRLEMAGVGFKIIGRLSTYGEARNIIESERIANVELVDFVPYATLAEYMAAADVCLGMFGDTQKARRAGAFKITEALAMRKPLITADTPAIREFLIDRENALLCKIADPEDLANKILELKDDPALREHIATKGYELFLARMTPVMVGRELRDEVLHVLRAAGAAAR